MQGRRPRSGAAASPAAQLSSSRGPPVARPPLRRARREVHEAAVLAGLVATEAVARGLKHLIRSPRPAESCALLGVCDAHGMPSSHTAMAFAYLALSAAAAASLAARQRPAARALAALEVCGCGAAAALVAASRV